MSVSPSPLLYSAWHHISLEDLLIHLSSSEHDPLLRNRVHLKDLKVFQVSGNSITSHHITSHHITSHHITSHHTPHHITSHHLTSHHLTSHHITSHHLTSHHITPYHLTSHHLTSQLLHQLTIRIHWPDEFLMDSSGAVVNFRNCRTNTHSYVCSLCYMQENEAETSNRAPFPTSALGNS